LLFVAARLFDRRGGYEAASFGVLAGVIWAAHPLRVEAVSWITERREVLCGALSMLALAAHLAGRRVGAFAIAIAAMLAKATAVVLPAILVLIDIHDTAPSGFDAWTAALRRAVRRHAPLFAVAVAIGIVAIFGQRHAEAAASFSRLGAGARAALFGHGVGFYVQKTLWPSGLAPLYELKADVRPIYLSGTPGAIAALRRLFGPRFAFAIASRPFFRSCWLTSSSSLPSAA
jgi:hypothetical protein